MPQRKNDPNSTEIIETLPPAYRPISPGLAIAPTVSVIIPARDEAANLPHVFGRLPSWVDEVVLVDGHSTDDTVAVTRALYPAAKVVQQPGRGKGDALQAGFAAATGDIMVTIDADGSTDGAEMIRFVGALLAGADLAKGSRFASGGGSDDITGLRRCGNRLLSALVNRMFGTHFTDLCYGYNAFWARHLDAIGVRDCPGFEVETLLNIRAAKAGLTIYEVPSHECPRIFGASNLRAVRDGWRILKVIMREWLAGGRRPRKQRSRVVTADTAIPSGESVPEREIAALFDRYAQQLYGYCRSRLSEPAATEAVQDTFIIAAAKISRLSPPERLRVWLFALARNECHRRLLGSARSAALYETAGAADDTDREISELSVRHGFYGADLADILGVPRDQAHILAARARSGFQKSLGVLPMARSARERCGELGTILDRQGGRTGPMLRLRVRRHLRRCAVCGVRRRDGLSPAIVLGMRPVAPLPAQLRRRTLDLVSAESPAATARRATVLRRTARFSTDGFPVQLASPSASGRRIAALAAAVATLALLGGVVYHVATGPVVPGGRPVAVAAGGARVPVPPAVSDPARTRAGRRSAVRPAPVAADRSVPAPSGFIMPSFVQRARQASPAAHRSPSRSPKRPAPSRSPSRSRSPSAPPKPSRSPTPAPSRSPAPSPSVAPSVSPSLVPSVLPSVLPSLVPSLAPGN